MTSTVSANLSRSHQVTRLALFLASSFAALVNFGRVISHRRQVAELMALNDRELKDIGLLRNDVKGALAQPFFTDPSTILSVRSVERRARARAVAVKADRTRPRVPFAARQTSPCE